MVSEEERDFMYRSYARDLSSRINLGIRRRLAPLVQNSRRRLELLNILLLSLPGTPVIYYGDEIGMGDNHFLGDRDGVRTPMQWSPDRNAGYSQVNPQRLFLPVIIDPEYHYQAVNVETEELNLSSQLWWMRRAIAMRRRYRAFSRGNMEFVKSSNASVLSFYRKLADEVVLVVVNLSRFSQSVSLDLRKFAGYTPFDVFSGNQFQRIGMLPYQMTLGFHDYFWMELRPDAHADPRTESYRLPDFEAEKPLADIFVGASAKWISTEVMPEYLQQRTTAGCRKKRIRQTLIIDRIPLKRESFSALLLIMKVRYADSDSDFIFLPLTVEPQENAAMVIGEDRGLIFGQINGGEGGIIYDCSFHPLFVRQLYELVKSKKALRGQHGVVAGESFARKNENGGMVVPSARLVKSGKRNTSIVLGEKVFVKLYRRIDEGPHPEIETYKKLKNCKEPVTARYAGSLSYRSTDTTSYAIGLFVDHFHHSRTLWHAAVDAVSRYLEASVAGTGRDMQRGRGEGDVMPDRSETTAASLFETKIGFVGELTAKMHRELAAGTDREFRPEPFSSLYQRSLYQSLRGLTHRVFSRVEAKLDVSSGMNSMELQSLAMRKKDILDIFMSTLKSKLSGVRMRIHGDYHIGQVMTMDERYLICDFEGLANSVLSERRLKRSPLRDIATMVHSLYYVAHYSLYNNVHIQEKDRQMILPRDQVWAATMGKAFVRSYIDAMDGTNLVSATPAESESLLQIYLLERALIELEKAIDQSHENLMIAIRSMIHYMRTLNFFDHGGESPGQP
jgi:maltose alpha-D-glucosyltransferase/alpha-amylase